MEAIAHRQQEGLWGVHEFVVMPNHLHLFCVLEQSDLFTVMTEFKRWTGHRASAALGLHNERFWHREWFDHWSRSEEEDLNIIDYIRDNPVKAGLVRAYYEWPYGSWADGSARSIGEDHR